MESFNFECTICLKNCKICEEIVSANCGHIFHNVCLKQKRDGSPQCPLCLAEVKTTTKLLFKYEAETSKDIEITELKARVDHWLQTCNQLRQQNEASKKDLKFFQEKVSFKTREISNLEQHIDLLTREKKKLSKVVLEQNTNLKFAEIKVQQQNEVNDKNLKTFEEQLSLKAREISSLKQLNDLLTQEKDKLSKVVLDKNEKLKLAQTKVENLQVESNRRKQALELANKKLEQITTKNKELTKDVETKAIEIQKLTAIFDDTTAEATTTTFETQIDVLKEKNKQLSLELVKEIRRYSELSTENLRLENLLRQSNLKTDGQSKVTAKESGNKLVTNPQAAKKNNDAMTDIQASDLEKTDAFPCVIIRNIKETFADEVAMKKYVFELFEIMELTVAEDDVLNVSYLNGRKLNKSALVIKFKSISSKNLVLSKLEILKAKSATQHLIVQDFVEDNSLMIALYRHATSLRSFGYKKVFLQNNKVYVSKSSVSEAIRIFCSADIMRLKNKPENSKE